MSSRPLVPTLKQHSNGSAYCKWRGKFYYFGTWRHPDMAKFRAFLAEISGGADDILAGIRKVRSGQHTIKDLINAYVAAKLKQYEGGEYEDNLKKYKFRWKQAYTPLLRKYGDHLVAEFGPRAFQEVRRALISNGRSRTYVNDLAAEIRLALQWGVAEEIVPVNVFLAIKQVKILRPGEVAKMPEGRDVKPVPVETVRATLPFLAPPVAAILELMTLTVSRPGEIARLDASVLDQNGPNGSWVYRPQRHKTAWKGKDRFVVFGKEAIEIIKKWWKSTGYFFINDRTNKPYTSEQLRKAIASACARAGIPYWFPYQIRHNSYSETSRKHGTEAAALLAGHSDTRMADRYDHSKVEKASRYSA